MSSFLAVRVSTERSQHTCGCGLFEETIGGEIVDRDRDHEPAVAIVRVRRPSRRVHACDET